MEPGNPPGLSSKGSDLSTASYSHDPGGFDRLNNRPFSAKASIKKFFRRHVTSKHSGGDLPAPSNGSAEPPPSISGRRPGVSQPILIAGSMNLPDKPFADKQLASVSSHLVHPKPQEAPQSDQPNPGSSPITSPKRRMSSRFKLSSDAKPAKSGSSQDPSPLYKALPRSIKHASLASSALPAETVLQNNAQNGVSHYPPRDDVETGITALASQPYLDPPPNQGSIRKLIHQDWNRKPSSLKTAETTHKLFLIMVNGYILQYSVDGAFDRPPEKGIQLGHKTVVAFASDALPGKPYLIQVSEIPDIADYTLPNEKKKFLNRFTFSEHKPQSTSMLLIFDTAEEMDIWLTILRKEIEHFGAEERNITEGWKGNDSIKRFSKAESLGWNLHLPIPDVQEQQDERSRQDSAPPSPSKSAQSPQLTPQTSMLGPSDGNTPSSPDTKRLSYASVGLMTISAADNAPSSFPSLDHSQPASIEERQSAVSPRSSIRRRSSPEPFHSEVISHEAPGDPGQTRRPPAPVPRNQGPPSRPISISGTRRSSAPQAPVNPPPRRRSVHAEQRFSQDLTDIPEITNDFNNKRHSTKTTISPVPKDDQSLGSPKSPRKRRPRRCSASAVDRTRDVSDPIGLRSHPSRQQHQQYRKPLDPTRKPSPSRLSYPPNVDVNVPEVPKVPENIHRKLDHPLLLAAPSRRPIARRPISMQPSTQRPGAASSSMSTPADPSNAKDRFFNPQRASVPDSRQTFRHRTIGPIPPEFYDFGNPPLSPPPSCPLPEVPSNGQSGEIPPSSRRQSRELASSSRRQSREVPGKQQQQQLQLQTRDVQGSVKRRPSKDRSADSVVYSQHQQQQQSKFKPAGDEVTAKELKISASSDRKIKRKSIPIVVPPDDDVSHADDLRAKEVSMINAF